jgi:hypothetical protein
MQTDLFYPRTWVQILEPDTQGLGDVRKEENLEVFLQPCEEATRKVEIGLESM